MIEMHIGGKLTVNGLISSNGTPGIFAGGWGAGGGSGGSIWLTCVELDGSGAITALGGAGGGDRSGGGGAGGRISICGAVREPLAVAILVGGGAGFQDGAPGSIYFPGSTASVFADLTGDGLVNGSDLGALLGAWGCTSTIAACGECDGADLNGSGLVNGADLGLLLGEWMPVQP